MRRDRCASSLVEFVFFVGVWVFLLSGFLVWVRLKKAQHVALTTARWATELQASGAVDLPVVEALIEQRLSRASTAGLQWSWQLGRFTGTSASRFYRLRSTRVVAIAPFSPLGIDEQVVIQEATQ